MVQLTLTLLLTTVSALLFGFMMPRPVAAAPLDLANGCSNPDNVCAPNGYLEHTLGDGLTSPVPEECDIASIEVTWGDGTADTYGDLGTATTHQYQKPFRTTYFVQVAIKAVGRGGFSDVFCASLGNRYYGFRVEVPEDGGDDGGNGDDGSEPCKDLGNIPPDQDSDGDRLTDRVECNITRQHTNGETIHLNPFSQDTDGDGLLDPWEVDPATPGAGFHIGSSTQERDRVFGPYGSSSDGTDAQGRVQGQYAKFVNPPDPFQKDLYFELDWQDCKKGGCPEVFGAQIDPAHHAPSVAALNDIMAVYASAPVENVDGTTGIHLHILVDEAVKHEPNCDRGRSLQRGAHFGTPQQRAAGNTMMTAKALAFRYIWSGHSTKRDNNQDCALPQFWELMQQGLGLAPLPDYDHSPTGHATGGSPDVLLSLGPIWVCPRYVTIDVPAVNPIKPLIPTLETVKHHSVCFRKLWYDRKAHEIRVAPGIFPAYIMEKAGRKDFAKPANELLGLDSKSGIRQIWGRTLMRLLGQALGLTDAAALGNRSTTPGRDVDDDGKNDVTGPAPYGNWNGLQYKVPAGAAQASVLEDVSQNDEELVDIVALAAADSDGDGVAEGIDNCAGIPNADQADLDQDGEGDACDDDIDGDGLELDGEDARPFDTDNDGVDNADDADDDDDGVDDAADNCPRVPNADQADQDNDGLGDPCDLDRDGDEVHNTLELMTGSDPAAAQSAPEFLGSGASCSDGLDNDGDGLTDAADEGCLDSDGDTAPDSVDNCPFVANAPWSDTDLDGVGDACDVSTSFLPHVRK